MQGINRAKHAHLIDALLHLQQIAKLDHHDTACAQQALAYSIALETRHKDYEAKLAELALQIEAYETLFTEVKIHFLVKKLKELRKQSQDQQKLSVHLTENIQLIYGT